MKNLEFKDIEGRYQDADGDEHVHVARVAVVTPDLVMVQVRNGEGDLVKRVRQVVGRDGNAIDLRVGDAVVETDKPGVYDVHPEAAWSKTGYSTGELVQNVGAEAAAVRATEPDALVTREPAAAGELQDIKELLTLLVQQQLANGVAVTGGGEPAKPNLDLVKQSTGENSPNPDLIKQSESTGENSSDNAPPAAQ